MLLKDLLRRFIPDVGNKNEASRDAWLGKSLSLLANGSRILDAGAGTQRNRQFCSHLSYVSQDFAEYDGEGNDAGLQMGAFDYGELDIVSDITDIPESDGAFDVVLCTEVLEHLPRPEFAISEFSRLTKAGGFLMITAPFCSLTHFAPYHYSTGFNRYWYEDVLARNSFEIIDLQANGNYFEYLAQEIKRLPVVGKRYASSATTTFMQKMCLVIILRMLKALSSKDSGSSELLCFGYHVMAKKKSIYSE